jgi:hypothetical protein
LEPRSAVIPQHGGTHYEANTGLCPHCGGAIQHWDLYADAPYLEGMATKYITRWRAKGGVDDLEKAITALRKRLAIERLRKAVLPGGARRNYVDQGKAGSSAA